MLELDLVLIMLFFQGTIMWIEHIAWIILMSLPFLGRIEVIPFGMLELQGGKKSHLDPDINPTIVSERFVNSPYKKKGMRKDGRLFRREIRGNESKES